MLSVPNNSFLVNNLDNHAMPVFKAAVWSTMQYSAGISYQA
jgi:hypothetical protein